MRIVFVRVDVKMVSLWLFPLLFGQGLEEVSVQFAALGDNRLILCRPI